ncbi:hypothetical protein M404DRAFT_1004132 [Pisolithus tinctorius Marx 270]|uniref:Uncharacterized protein n=1 Tax=Pisolithus tinctorius Marx 270 TaxID=870435 RepID=A0A0C3ITI9_PISTI|nr:hypothetical protein M404DRAFT_1004132 [Pisolithus tinctorius Marx 270]
MERQTGNSIQLPMSSSEITWIPEESHPCYQYNPSHTRKIPGTLNGPPIEGLEFPYLQETPI